MEQARQQGPMRQIFSSNDTKENRKALLKAAANGNPNLRSNVRVPPPPRARRALSRSRPPAPSRERERERPRRSRAARVSGRAILSASARRRGASPRERTSPPHP